MGSAYGNLASILVRLFLPAAYAFAAKYHGCSMKARSQKTFLCILQKCCSCKKYGGKNVIWNVKNNFCLLQPDGFASVAVKIMPLMHDLRRNGLKWRIFLHWKPVIQGKVALWMGNLMQQHLARLRASAIGQNFFPGFHSSRPVLFHLCSLLSLLAQKKSFEIPLLS